MPGTTAPHILVFDSGVGGLTIYDHITRQLPDALVTYAMDTACFPYGTKSETWLKAEVPALVNRFVAQCDADIAVIACNTASTIALEDIRAQLDIPVVGTVPAIKPAAAKSTSNVIGLLATPGTIHRLYTQDLIAQFAAECTVVRHGSAALVEIAEDKIQGKTLNMRAIKRELQILFSHDTDEEMDVVVLACTHFPILLDELKSVAPRTVYWIDSGAAIASRVASILAQTPSDRVHKAGPALIATSNALSVNAYKEAFAKRGIEEIVSMPRSG